MVDPRLLRLYLIASADMGASDPLSRIMEAAAHGVSMVQLREKELSTRLFIRLALDLKKRLSPWDIPLIINDRVDVAMAAGAHGVHLGRSDMPVKEARSLLGPGKIIGFSASSPDDALQGCGDGADYIGAGALFPTATKKDAAPLSLDDFEQIARGIPLPVVAIGGITPDKVSLLFSRGAAGVAVSSAILQSENIPEAVKSFLEQKRD